MNPATLAYFTRGEGAVLNECSGFLVSGYSPPNFLAWSCDLRGINPDGTTPALPAEIKFTDLVTRVTVKVASAASGSMGTVARLSVYNAANEQVATQGKVLAANMKTLTASDGTRDIKYARLTGPCVMVADDFVITR